MKIVLTNDDGIHALGLCALHEALSQDHEVIVVAPDGERSAVGHAITLADPIKVRQIPFSRNGTGWAINGTPADCVKLALNCLVEGPVDLVISGINVGANVGINVLYSGTVSAATEAAILGVKGIAISLDTLRDPQFCGAALYAKEIAEWFVSSQQESFAINVNVPSIAFHRIRGVKVTKQATFSLRERFERRTDPRGNTYYWQCLASIDHIPDHECDIAWLRKDYITVTPLRHDLTLMEKIGDLSPPEPV
jgi:5'-nucleotidase